ncbi:hypothetical protein CRUP_014748 [Coryphaenoides rupestris]|nr:hypothetical protein CRUP_014748 [Coryphaenoides rupestris]
MMSPVTKAMVEAYALMILVMGSFFVYFCGMVWAFCNPVLSGGEEDHINEVLLDAMVEAYALMILVMGSFFVYFCGMVWAFCNPVLSGGEEDHINEVLLDGAKSTLWRTEPVPQQRFCTGADPEQRFCTGADPEKRFCTGADPEQRFCTGADPEQLQQNTRAWLAQTYVQFGGDTDSLLLDRNDQVRECKTRASPV